MDSKMSVAFANIFMAKVETDILFHLSFFSIWNVSREEIATFIEQAD